MELHLSRSQKSGMMGGVKFTLTMKATLTPEEEQHINKYKFYGELLYEQGSDRMAAAKSTLGFLTARLAQLRVTVSDLVGGKSIECKDILEMMEAEDAIKSAAERFHIMLKAAAKFEGEEVIEFT